MNGARPSNDTFQTLHDTRQAFLADCLRLRKRAQLTYPIGMTGALMLEEVQLPWVHPSHHTANPPTKFTFIVPHQNKKSHIDDVSFAPWNIPMLVKTEERFSLQYTVGPCTWLMMSLRLDPMNVVVLAESMMRRQPELKRASLQDFTTYLDELDEYASHKENGRRRAIRGSKRARLLLSMARENTDSPMETRLGLRISQFGLGRPAVNHPLRLRNGHVVLLDTAFRKAKVAVEYDGDFHRDQWGQDSQRRTLIEDEGWIYVQVTKHDLADPLREHRLMERIATKLQERMGTEVPLAQPMPLIDLAKFPELYENLPWL